MNQPIVEDLVTASHILANEGVLDGLGHISVRHPGNPQRYLMSRSLAPALVNPLDIMEYDLDSNAVDRQGRTLFLERFIHGEIYKARSDVMSVIHSHSPAVIPFSISQTPLQPVFNGAAFLSPSAPVFDIRQVAGMTDLLIAKNPITLSPRASAMGQIMNSFRLFSNPQKITMKYPSHESTDKFAMVLKKLKLNHPTTCGKIIK